MRLITFIILVTGGAVLGGLYGSLHNQLSYTVSPEFFTKVRFGKFGMDTDSGRVGAGIIGWKNTWKIGLALSFCLTIVGLIHPSEKSLSKNTIKAIAINLLIAFLFGLLGLIIGLYFSETAGLSTPDSILDKRAFMAVEIMHNFSYIGGLIGLCIAIIWQIFSLKEYR